MVGQVVDLVGCLEGIDNLEVEQRIDLGLHVILGNHVLLGEVIDLFAEVDGSRIHVASVIEYDNRLSTVDKGNDDVDTRLERGIIASETLYDFRLRLGDNHECHLGKDYHQYDDGNQNVGHNVHIC